MKKIFSFNDYLKKNYHKTLYRVPIDLALSCPHRDIKSGKGGCIFCSENGSRAIHLQDKLNLQEQVKKGVNYIRSRYDKDCGLIAYFQTFTNTFGEPKNLEKLYDKILELENFDLIMLSTRPDCLSDEIIEVLLKLQAKKDLWIELGVQTANNETLKLINRGHNFSTVETAIKKLNANNIPTVAHLILGLPGETIKDYLETAKKIAKLPFSAVKIHNLLVLKNTPIAKMYQNGEFECLNEYEYADALVKVLQQLPDNWPVMRINADAPKAQLIAPKWGMKKGQFITYVNSLLEDASDDGQLSFPKVKTADGSYTFYHHEFKQHFHTMAGAKSEAEKKFIEPSEVRNKLLSQPKLTVLDIGFGLGYNAINTLKVAENIQKGKLKIISLEQDLTPLKIAKNIYETNSLDADIINQLIATKKWNGNYSSIELLCNDARESILNLRNSHQKSFEIIYLDAFSPDKNPELWTFDLFKIFKEILTNNGIIISYSSAYPIRGGLLRAGFKVGETTPFGRRRGGTIASISEQNIITPLPAKELNIIMNSTSGTPYRDIHLNSNRKKICELRTKTVRRLRKKGIPKWISNK